METEGIASRLKYLINFLGLSDSQFADRCGISRATLSLLLSGKNKKISDVLLSQIHNAFPQVSILWLLFKEGESIINENLNDQGKNKTETNLFTDSASLWPDESYGLIDDSEKGDSQNLFYTDTHTGDSGKTNLIGLNVIEKQIQEAVNKGFERYLKNYSSIGLPDNFNEKEKKIRQITVYYDDSTFETFSPGR